MICFQPVRFVTLSLLGLLLTVASPAQIARASVKGDANARTPLPLGKISNVRPAECSPQFASGASCFSAVVSCPSTPDLGVTLGISSGPAGTIAFMGGSGGTAPGGTTEIGEYQNHGFGIAQFAFASDWEDGANDIRTAACRPATVLDYFYNREGGGIYCAQGISAGSSGLGYSLAWYGLDAELDNVELSVGPVFSDITQGCQVPKAPRVTIIPTNGGRFNDNPQYVGGEINSLTRWTGQQCLPPEPTSQNANASWTVQSVVQDTATLTYPYTSVSGWVCDNGLNPSAAQAYLFFSQVTSSWDLTRLSKCTGAEGIETGVTPQGVLAETAIANDMLTQCVNRHPRK
jgi:hypothetical protein